MVKNATFYRFTGDMPELTQALANVELPPFTRCASNQLKSGGFVKPFQDVDCIIGTSHFFCYKIEERILPAQAIREELARRCTEIGEREGRIIRGKEKQALKDEVIVDMTPKAFTKTKKMYGCLDTATKLFTVFTPTASVAEDFLTALREALGSLAVTPLRSTTSPCATLTAWANDTSPFQLEGFEIGEKCKIHAIDGAGEVSCKGIEISEESVQCHLIAGRMIVELALSSEDAITFTLTDDLVIKSVKFGDLLDEVENDGTALWMMNQKLTEIVMKLVNQMGGILTD